MADYIQMQNQNSVNYNLQSQQSNSNFIVEVYKILMENTYSVLDCMLPNDLEYLRDVINEELSLRKFKDDRLKKMKMELLQEKEKFKQKLIKEQHKLTKEYSNESESEEDLDEEVEIKPKKKAVKKASKK